MEAPTNRKPTMTAPKTEVTPVAPVVEKPAAAASVVTPTAAPTVAPDVEAKPEYRMIATVYGDMHDPHTGLSFTLKPCELLKHSGWIDSQVEAGKMVYVD